MNNQLIAQLFELCIIPMFGALTAYAVKWINAKANSLKTSTDNVIYRKYLDLLDNTITKCVIATNQTYVNTLKAKGEFTPEAQREAFTKTYEAVIQALNQDAYIYLEQIAGDFNVFLTQRIEAEVNKSNK